MSIDSQVIVWLKRDDKGNVSVMFGDQFFKFNGDDLYYKGNHTKRKWREILLTDGGYAAVVDTTFNDEMEKDL